MSAILTVAGERYRRWISVRVTRGLKRCCSDFQLEIPGELVPAIVPFQPCTVSDGDGTLLLTGYIARVRPKVGPRDTRATIIGKSKTTDLVECMPEFATNQFNGYAFDAIARAIAKPFGIGVVVGPGVVIGDAFPDATITRAETGFAFLERLARQRALMLTDDENGNLVIATAGTVRAPAPLVMGQGGNVHEAEGDLNGEVRFSQYTIRSQAGMWQTGSEVLTNVEAIARDGGVPRYRPWAGMAESASMPGDAQKRANWQAAHRSGEAVKAMLTVPEWRVGGPDGPLWQQNQVAACDVPRLGLTGDFLIGEVQYHEDGKAGRSVRLEVSPPSAFAPEPRRGKGTGNAWEGIIKVAGPAGGET